MRTSVTWLRRDLAAAAFSRAAAGAAIATGLSRLAGFGPAAMARTTGGALALLGLAAWTGGRPARAGSCLPARLASAAAALLGLANFAAYVSGTPPAGAPGSVPMAPDTSICLAMLGAAFFFGACESVTPFEQAAGIAASLASGVAGLTLLLWMALFGTSGWFGLTSMAPSTAALVASLGFASAFSLSAKGKADWALGRRATAALAAAVFAVLTNGLVANRLSGARAELPVAVGTFGGVLGIVAGFLIVNAVLARSRAAEIRYEDLFQANRDALLVLEHPSRRFIRANAAAVAMFRAGSEAALTRYFPADLSPEVQPDGVLSALKAAGMEETLTREGVAHFEWRHRRLDGQDFDASVMLTRLNSGGKTYVQVTVRDLSELRRAEDDLRLLSSAVEQASEAIVITDANARILYVNPSFTRITGYPRGEAVGRTPSILKSGRQDAAFYAEMWANLLRGETWRGRLFNRRKSGEIYEEEASIAPVRGPGGTVTHYIAVKRDVTRERDLEKQFLHSQRMEAVGRLAGGIAHDFNNLLSAIMGSAYLLGSSVPAGTPAAEDVAAILDAGGRAAALTRQMLTFSRRDPAKSSVNDLNASVRGIQKLVGRTLGEDVRVSVSLAEGPVWIDANPGEIDQVLLNLAVNARDAMPGGGGLKFSTCARELATARSSFHDAAPPGAYGVLRCEDTGTGMTDEVLTRIFEPFFTTKEVGKGTGLGLSTVFGIVRRCGGHIFVDSAPGLGTAFEILFPLAAPPVPAADGEPAGTRVAPRAATVMLVEDEDAVLKVFHRALKAQGYTVLCARNAEEALVVSSSHRGAVDLLLTDVVMPGLSGDELARRIVARRPGTKVLFMSGYAEGRLGGLDAGGRSAGLLQKPFPLSELTERVRLALGAA